MSKAPPQTTLDLSGDPIGPGQDGFSIILATGSGNLRESALTPGEAIVAPSTGASVTELDQVIPNDGAASVAGSIPLSVTHVIGTAGNDMIVGNDLNDTLNGGLGDDIIVAVRGGNTTLIGGPGNDVLVVAYGNNTMWGGVQGATPSSPSTGADAFVFVTPPPKVAVSHDLVMDFGGNDTLTFQANPLTGASEAPTSWTLTTVNGVASIEGVAFGGAVVVTLVGVTEPPSAAQVISYHGPLYI